MANGEEPEGIALQEFHRNDLKLGEPIGHGVFGYVHKVRRAPGFGTVAVKLFARKVKTRAVSEVRELTAALKLSHHPNILAFHGFLFESPDDPPVGFVMEYMSNGSLHDVTRDKSMNYEVKHVINWCVQAARGLAFCHSHNVIHRDVKPANLVLSHHFTTLKVCDFGFARNLGESMTQKIGSKLYMAPEVMVGTKYDHNVYSFAMTIWEICHKRHAANHDNSLRWAKGVREGVRPDITSHLADALISELIESGWIGEPENRCTMQQMLQVLEAASIDNEPEQLEL